MSESIAAWLSVTCLVLAILGCVYTLAATLIVRRAAGRPSPRVQAYPGVTILKPLSGAELGLYENLASFCTQNYPGPLQILFGVQDPEDSAIAIVREVIANSRGRDAELIIDTRRHGVNAKVANLINMAVHIKHGTVVLADSDVRVRPDYLSCVIGALSHPGVGLVTCLYRGAPGPGLWARLNAMAIDYHFLPGVLVGLRLGLARPCFGSTIALTRETLAAIGGFEAFADHLADDNAMGGAVRRAGMQVAIPAFSVEHACTDASLAELVRHELRWARTIRAVDPWGFAGSAVTYPLPFALLGAALGGFAPAGVASILAALACRLVLQLQVDHTVHSHSGRWWLGPVRDVLSFAIFVGSFFVAVVSWRGERYKVRSDGTLVSLREVGS